MVCRMTVWPFKFVVHSIVDIKKCAAQKLHLFQPYKAAFLYSDIIQIEDYWVLVCILQNFSLLCLLAFEKGVLHLLLPLGIQLCISAMILISAIALETCLFYYHYYLIFSTIIQNPRWENVKLFYLVKTSSPS